MSVEMFPNLISHLLCNHAQIVKPLHVSEEENGHEFSYNSPCVAHDPSTWDDTTFGEKCRWLPHHNQHTEVHDKFHEVCHELQDVGYGGVASNTFPQNLCHPNLHHPLLWVRCS